MRRCALVSASLAVIAFAMPAMSNEDVLRQSAKPEQLVLQTGDYANQRFSKLDQINRDNVKNLKVAWTFSTGVLRGHEGSPLVVGEIMYVHTPFPNIVYALDLNEDGKILWKYEPIQDPSVIPVMC
jgi:glucose dehydrogenase